MGRWWRTSDPEEEGAGSRAEADDEVHREALPKDDPAGPRAANDEEAARTTRRRIMMVEPEEGVLGGGVGEEEVKGAKVHRGTMNNAEGLKVNGEEEKGEGACLLRPR